MRFSDLYFTIIDFAFYRHGNILFDIAYLEIAILWQLFKQYTSKLERDNWKKLEIYLRQDLMPSKAFDGKGASIASHTIIHKIRERVANKAKIEERGDDYWLAYLAASVEAGLTLAFYPERIAKTPVDQPRLRFAALLTAASRFHRLLELLNVEEELNIHGKSDRASLLEWPETVSDTISLTTAVSQNFDQIPQELISYLRSGKAILVVGDIFAKEVWGVPQDGELMREVALLLNISPPEKGGGSHNILAFDWLRAGTEQKQQAIHRFFSNFPFNETLGWANLTLLNWAAIMEWSFTRKLYDSLVSRESSWNVIKPIWCHTAPATDFRSPGFTPFIFLRGSTDTFLSLALGMQGFNLQRETRRTILKSLFRALPFKPVLLFVGFDKKIIGMVLNEFRELLDHHAKIWVISRNLSEEMRMEMELSHGHRVGALSAIEFLNLCGYVSERPEEQGAERHEVYTLSIKGIEPVTTAEGVTYFRRADLDEKIEHINIKKDDFLKIDPHLEIVYDQIGINEDNQGRTLGDFYKGHPPLWKELAQELPIWRQEPGDRIINVILGDLKDNRGRRLSLWSQAGAGATTLIRQLGSLLSGTLIE